MRMMDYLKEIEYAATSVLMAMWAEQEEFDTLKKKLELLTIQVQEGYNRAHWISMNAEDVDDVMLATGIHWDTYFGPDKELYEAEENLKMIEDRMKVRAFSISALAGFLLQYAKQGISLVHGGLNDCPAGRFIGSQSLKEIIWHSRNQSMHWEERKFRASVERCFETLSREIHPKLGDYKTRNMALDVVEMLRWRTYADFEHDLLLLQ